MHWNSPHPHAPQLTPTSQALPQQKFWGSASAEAAASDNSFPPTGSWQKGMPVLLREAERQKPARAQPHQGSLPSTEPGPAQGALAPADACSVSGAGTRGTPTARSDHC